jgi:glycine oxidase
VREVIVRNQRIVAVETGTERLEAGHVIVACGAWTSDLLGPLSQGANVFPVKGQMLLLAGEPGMVRNIVMKDGCYVIPRRDGKLLVGSTLEFAGFDKATTQEARTLLLESAYELLPQLHDVALARHWAGLRPGSHEGIPAICRHPEVSGLFINAGHFRNGVVMGPAAARLTADLALERSPILDPAPYQMIRPLPGSVRHNKVS